MFDRVPARHLLAVASGKGGVGKSTITMNMAVVLAQQGARVGLVDCDVYGPDIPAMVGLTRRKPASGWTLSRRGGSTPIEPIERFGVSIVSTGLLFGEEQPLSWPAPLIGVLVNQLLQSSAWPDLDYLILDMPPGTADITQTVFQAAPQARAIVVVTPQEVAHLDARKLVAFLRGNRTAILGGVDNMAGFTCPCCHTVTDIFPPVDPQRSIWSNGVERLGTLPLDPGPPGDDPGVPVAVSRPDSAFTAAMRATMSHIRERLDERAV